MSNNLHYINGTDAGRAWDRSWQSRLLTVALIMGLLVFITFGLWS